MIKSTFAAIAEKKKNAVVFVINCATQFIHLLNSIYINFKLNWFIRFSINSSTDQINLDVSVINTVFSDEIML